MHRSSTNLSAWNLWTQKIKSGFLDKLGALQQQHHHANLHTWSLTLSFGYKPSRRWVTCSTPLRMHTARSKKQQLAFLYLVVQKWKSSSFSKRKHSWQAYLERISPFLLACKGIWWWEAQDGSRYIFFDWKDKADNHCEGPQLLHFRNVTIKDVIRRQNEAWQTILEG